MKLGFIGLGKMGAAIAKNLLGAGHSLTVYNRTPQKADELAKDGAQTADSAGAAAKEADAVFTMLSDDSAVSEVTFGASGLAATLPEGAVHISCSTISTALARKLNEEHATRKQKFLSAPVFGRPDAALTKKLIVVAAGEANVIERCRPLLDAIGRQTFSVGHEPWQANAVKVCGNFMIASLLEEFGETFAVMRKSGIDHHVFLSVISELFGSPIYKNYGGAIAQQQFEPAGFALKLGLKDVRLALDAAGEVGAPMPFASILRDHFISAMADGQQDFDWSSVALVSARNAGLTGD